MRTELIYPFESTRLPEGMGIFRELMPGEVQGMKLERVSVNRRCTEPATDVFCDVYLVMTGHGTAITKETGVRFGPGYVIRPPWRSPFSIEAGQNEPLQLLRIRISLTPEDVRYISTKPGNFGILYLKAISESPVYTEDIKSNKTVNRMILPEGMVPRFCMGSVETSGPDCVAEHVHPMLDQLFLGLKGCRCQCYAGDDHALLEENMLLHIPLGAKHRVEVDEGNLLAYIWLDFFLTIEGQKYMNEQHQVKDPE